MGVSLNYKSSALKNPLLLLPPVLDRVEAFNETREWWCESIWITEDLDIDGGLFGATKLFCMIHDQDTDTYMAFLDVCVILKFLADLSNAMSVEWEVSIEDGLFGHIACGAFDETLKTNVNGFLEWFPGDFTDLKTTPREAILEKWSDR